VQHFSSATRRTFQPPFTLGLDIMARGVLQDWLATMFNQYDQIAAKLLPAIEAATIKPKTAPPIGEPLSAKRGAKVNLTN
jgi:hypothetical protein